MKKMIFFQFPKNIFAAYYQQQIILLDITNNEYLSLSNEAVTYLSFIIKNAFKLQRNVYTPLNENKREVTLSLVPLEDKTVNAYIVQFLKNNIIECFSNELRNNYIAVAHEPIGLSNTNWLPTKKDNYPKITFIGSVKTFLALIKIHYVMKNKGLQGLINLLNSESIKYKSVETNQDINLAHKLAYLIDKMCFIYPKKTWCLAWAATLTYLLIKQGRGCSFVMGVQTLPFYAHAWVEVDKEVINDNPEIRKRLAPILKLTF